MKRTGQTEEKIVACGKDLLQSRGVNGFSFADIAKEMGIRKASIHYYFPSKGDLITRVLQEYAQQFEKDLAQIKDEADTLFQQLVDFTGLYRQELEQDYLCLTSMLTMDKSSLSDDVNQAVQDFFQFNIQWLSGIFKEAKLSEKQAVDFYASIQGAQLLARATNSIDDFDQLMVDKIVGLQNK